MFLVQVCDVWIYFHRQREANRLKELISLLGNVVVLTGVNLRIYSVGKSTLVYQLERQTYQQNSNNICCQISQSKQRFKIESLCAQSGIPGVCTQCGKVQFLAFSGWICSRMVTLCLNLDILHYNLGLFDLFNFALSVFVVLRSRVLGIEYIYVWSVACWYLHLVSEMKLVTLI